MSMYTPTDGPAIEMPRYKCHKEVWALKIKEVRLHKTGNVELLFDDCKYAPTFEPPSFNEKHHPVPGGYLVVYKDGYRSFSPADAFEDGYTLVS